MDPITIVIILAVYGALHASKNGVKLARASAALSRTSAQRKLPKNASKPIMADTRRRATAGWWAREIGNGFPVTLAGARQGWAAHTEAAAGHTADTTEKRATVAERLAEHKLRTEAAQRRLDAATPPKPVQQPATPVMAPPLPVPGGWNGQTASPPPISQTPGNQTPSGQAPPGQTAGPCPDCGAAYPDPHTPWCPWNYYSANQTPGGTVPAPGPDCTDPDCNLCHPKQSASGQAPASPSASPNGGPAVAAASDTTYDGAIATCQQVQTKIDEAVNDPALAVAEQLADSLGPMFPDDSESLGAAGDLVSALQAVKAAQQAAIEAAGVLESMIKKNHEAANEAAKATGHMAEREFHSA